MSMSGRISLSSLAASDKSSHTWSLGSALASGGNSGRSSDPAHDAPLTADPLVKTTRCKTIDELGSGSAREVIWRACRAYFETNRTIPLELLYGSRHQEMLFDSGSVFLGASQKVAIAQVGGTQQPVAERLKELYALVLGWQKLTRAYEMKTGATATAGGLEALLRSLPGKPEEKQPLAMVAIVRMLAPIKGYVEKFEAVMDLAADPSEEAVAVLDPFLGELLQTNAVIDQLLHDLPVLEDRLYCLLAMSRGSGDLPAELPEGVTRLADWMMSRKMPACQATLQDAMIREIQGTKPLTKGNNPRLELRAILHLRKSMTDANGIILGGSAVAKAFDRRCASVINISTIDRITGTTTSIAGEIEEILPLLNEPIGTTARDFLMSVLEQMVQACRTTSRLLGDGVPAPEQLRTITRFYSLVEKIDFGGTHRENVLKGLASLHADTVMLFDPMGTIEARQGTVSLKAMALIELCRSGMLMPGAYLERTRKLISDRIKTPDFMTGYMASCTEPAQRAQRLAGLRVKLSEAGVPA